MENISLIGGNTERLSHCGDDARINIGTPHMNGSTPINVITPPGGISGGGGNVINNNNVIGGNGGSGGGNVGRVTSIRRPQQQQQQQQQHISSSIDQKLLSLTIHKDSNGYGMKVSGDNPVFVESVKNGGAAQKAGLIAGDMILKVNGVEVRSEKHPTVVELIKSHTIVELTVRRSLKMQRPTSVGIGPGTPILSRDRATSITGPQPVDNDKRRELEFHKIKTLQLMLEQEKKNLENLKTYNNSANNRQDRARAEANIRQLQEQLRQVGGEDAITLHFLTTTSPNPPTTLITPPSHHGGGGLFHHITPQQNSSPAFLSRFPRSLSSLSLGTRKQKEKDLITSPINQTIMSPSDFLATQNIINNTKSSGSTTPLSTSQSMSQSMFQKYQQHKQHHSSQQQNIQNSTPTKKKFIGKDDIPPPLPQRNPPRINIIDNNPNNDWRTRNVPISDLDLTMQAAASGLVQSPKRTSPNSSAQNNNNNNNVSLVSGSGGGKSSSSSGKKRPKSKTKALSDPKMSTQLFLQMEKGENYNDDDSMIDISIPPPLPPRQPGMMEENQNLANLNKQNNISGNNIGRPIPNSVETLMNYPLISTCTAIRDNLLNNQQQPGPQQRSNIVQQYNQHQQNLQQQFHNHQYHLNKTPSTQNSAITTSKSTALGQTPQNHFNKHRRVVSSPDNMHPKHDKQLDRHNKSSSGSWDLLEKENEMTPPETPPPPYQSSQNLMSQSQIVHGSYQLTSQGSEETDHLFLDSVSGGGCVVYPNQIVAAQANTIQKKIISMEDEEVSDQECIVDEHGPFNHLTRLLEQENIVHLAVFLNYVLSNSDPAPLLFYLITGLYKEGTVKDMRKWAYEIHSTFLVPLAPLMWFTADESLAREVDNVLQNEYDKVEILRKVFWKSRKKSKERIYDQLIDFQQKRTAGLGTIYGPSDSQLSDARGDKTKEQKIFEETLLKKLQYLVDEIDKEAPNEDCRKLALCSALSTVLQRIFITRSNPGSPIDRVHHFVSREKSFKRIMGKHRKIVVRGHPLTLRQYYEVTHCNHCQLIIWGVSPQGYHCTDCKLNIHRPCSKVLEESCPGPVPQKRKEPNTDNKISKFMGKIRPSHNFIQNERRMESSTMATDDIFFSGLRKVLIKTSVPSQSLPTRSHQKKISHRRLIVKQPSENVHPNNNNATVIEEVMPPLDQTYVESTKFVDKETQTIKIRYDIRSEMLCDNLSEFEIKYYTGFDKERFDLLYSFLKTNSSPFESYMSCKNQVVLTMIKYRRGLDFTLIAKLYKIHRNVVSSIFMFWTTIIYSCLKKIDFWNLRYKKINAYTAIIDCTEIQTQKSSSNPNVNQHLFSNYKNYNTFKYLIAIDEKGLITFCSKVYGGSKSDRFIIEDSKFLDLLRSNDTILADRGFNISDLLEEKNVAINLPAFKTTPQFKPIEVLETRIVANRRIHVERVINLTKKNKILSNIIPSIFWPKINEIVFNANILCNLKDRVIK